MIELKALEEEAMKKRVCKHCFRLQPESAFEPYNTFCRFCKATVSATTLKSVKRAASRRPVAESKKGST